MQDPTGQVCLGVVCTHCVFFCQFFALLFPLFFDIFFSGFALLFDINISFSKTVQYSTQNLVHLPIPNISES